MKPAPTSAATAAFAFALCATLVTTVLGGASVAVAQGQPVAPSMDLSNAPLTKLAPTVHQQALAATPAPQVELWRGAMLGMTLDQVKKLLPDGRGPAPVGTAATAPAQDDGTEALWQTDDQVYGRAGVATFFFRSGGLASVIVDMNDVKSHATIGNMQDARALETAFSGYYGKPKLCFDSTMRGLDRIDCRWQGHGLRIGLSYQDFGGASAYMAIGIRPLPPALKAKTPFFGKKARKPSSL